MYAYSRWDDTISLYTVEHSLLLSVLPKSNSFEFITLADTITELFPLTRTKLCPIPLFIFYLYGRILNMKDLVVRQLQSERRSMAFTPSYH